MDALKGNLLKAVGIAKKDAKIYFFKGPNITFGLLFQAIIYLAFSVGRTAEISLVIPGLVAMSSLFGAGAIESLALPLERAKGTFDRLLAAPISLTTIIVGKALGVCISTPFRDVPQAMPPATLIRVAMVFLGGVFIPITAMPGFLQLVAHLLPITYAVDLLQQATTGQIFAV